MLITNITPDELLQCTAWGMATFQRDNTFFLVEAPQFVEQLIANVESPYVLPGLVIPEEDFQEVCQEIRDVQADRYAEWAMTMALRTEIRRQE